MNQFNIQASYPFDFNSAADLYIIRPLRSDGCFCCRLNYMRILTADIPCEADNAVSVDGMKGDNRLINL